MSNLIFCGDLHGKWRELVWKLVTKLGIKDSSIVIAGDIGMGFDRTLKFDYQKFKKKLEKNNLTLYCIRGNHDDPSYFDGELKEELEGIDRIKFLQDYVPVEIEGKIILPIGGAISIDRELRKKEKKVCWWEGEDVKRIDILKIPTKVDIIVSHESPLSFDPIITERKGIEEDIFNEALETRRYLDQVLFNTGSQCKRWYFGHHHKSFSGSYGGILYRGLEELELVRWV